MAGNKHWSESERKILKQHFPFISSPKLSKALPGRTTRSVNGQALRLGLRKVPERIVEMARENFASRPKAAGSPASEGSLPASENPR